MLLKKKVVTNPFRYTSSLNFLKKYKILSTWDEFEPVSYWLDFVGKPNLADGLPCFGEKTAYTRYHVHFLSWRVGIGWGCQFLNILRYPSSLWVIWFQTFSWMIYIPFVVLAKLDKITYCQDLWQWFYGEFFLAFILVLADKMPEKCICYHRYSQK